MSEVAASAARRRRRRIAAARAEATRPLSVLVLGRTKRRFDGGIARSGKMIVDALGSVGDVARLRNVKEILTDIPQGTDIILHYGDYDHLPQQVAAAKRAGVPIVVNSTFDDLSDRRRWMVNRLEELDPEGSGLVLLGVFTLSAQHDVRLQKIWDRLVVIPKTVRAGRCDTPFEKRFGICVGEIEKIGRERLVRGLDVKQALNALRSALPDVELVAYNQYGTLKTWRPEGVRLQCYQGKGFLEWLARFRLYVSLVRHETFSMVPAEAQSLGIPVLYRHMPQSLTEQLGMTGVPYDSVEELVHAAVRLYEDERSWSQLSEAGRLNAHGRSVRHVGAALDWALRRALLRSRGA